MKRIAVAAAAAALVLLLLGCYWTTGTGTGELSLQVCGVAPKGLGDYYGRVYLLANGARFALRPDAEYVEVPLSQYEPTTVIVDGVPAGPVYTALVSIVRQEEQGYYTDQWAESAPFTITPGRIVAVPLELQWGEFSPVWGMMGKDVKDVEVQGTSIYAADAGNIHTGSAWELWNMPSWSYPVTSGHTINSLTMGQDFSSGFAQLWANTDRGILPSNGEGFDAPLTVKLGTVSVLDSAWGSAQNGGDFLLYFRRAEGFGGTYISASQLDPSQWTWVNVGSVRTLDLTTGLEQAEPYSSEHGLLATASGAFRVPEGFLKDTAPTLPLTAPAPIRSLVAFNNDGREQLYIGTDNGAFRNDAWSAPEARYPEPGTAGYPIRKIAYYDGSGFRAYLSDAYIFVVGEEPGPVPTTVLKGVFPFVSGFPGKVNAIQWTSDGSTGSYLLVATDQGLVYKYF